MKHNNFTQNEKISQVREDSLVIGVDIASEKHYARAYDWRGMELGKVISFENNHIGFKRFETWINRIKENYSKENTIVGMEPTGHYWFCLADYVKHMNTEGNGEYTLVMVNPFHVKRSKELGDNAQTKNDKKDAMTIAKLVVMGNYSIPYIPEGVYAKLRIVMSGYYEIVEDMNRLKNKIKRWLSVYFPEYGKLFKDPCRKRSMVILKNVPLPQELVQIGAMEINQLWRERRMSGVGMKKSLQIYNTALKSIGIKIAVDEAKYELKRLIEDYEYKARQHEIQLKRIEALCVRIPQAKNLIEINGSGIIGVAGFFAEVGDISRFKSAKQIQKLAGFSIVENSSGKHNGKTRISRRGRKKLRTSLFRMIIALVSNNDAFRQIHDYYIKRSTKPLKKKQSIVLLCCKMIRIIFSIVKKQKDFSEKKMLSDIIRPAETVLI